MNARPSRTKAVRSYKESESAADDDSDYQEKDELEPSISTAVPARKSRKRAAPKSHPNKKQTKRGNTGKLEAVTKELPKEVVFLILSHLDPRTLISISRTNKQFRDTLLSSDLFWKASRQAAGMPELEAPDITERQYILLVFDKNCHNCSKANVQEINFVNCARLCSLCRQETRVTEPKRRKLLNSLHPMAERCAKYTGDSGYRIPRGIVKMSERLHRMRGAELDTFVEQRRLLKEQIEKDARKIEDWLNKQASNKYKEDEANQKSREEDIKKHLLASGWTDKTLPRAWAWKSQVQQPRKLTSRIWKAIEGPLVRALRSDLIQSRNDMRRNALIPHYKNLLQEDHEKDLFPSRATFFAMPSVKAVWEKDSGPDPPAVELQSFTVFDEAEWLAALPSIRASVVNYQQDMKVLAADRLSTAFVEKGLPVPASLLDDPRSYFRYRPKQDLDWPVDEDLVLPFPAIHAAMRDRQDGPSFSIRGGPCAAEFKSVSGVRDWWGLGETLNVELKDV